MKIKITGSGMSSYWYSDKIGQEFTVNKRYGAKYVVHHNGTDNTFHVNPEDCEEIVETPMPAIRHFEHDGKTYVVPEWANYITCDGEGKMLFGWENEPSDKSDDAVKTNFYISKGKRMQLAEYVKPLAVGAFIKKL